MKLIRELTKLTEMAKRISLADFHKLCVDKYGAEKAKALSVPEIQTVAHDKDVMIPSAIWKNKVSKGRFTAGQVDEPKTDDKKDAQAAPAKSEEPKKVEIKSKYSVDDFDGQTFIESVRYTNFREFLDELKKRFGVSQSDTIKVQVGEPKRYEYVGTITTFYVVNKDDPTIVYAKAEDNKTARQIEYMIARTRADQKKIDDDKWAFWVMPQHGKSYLSTGTEHSIGPWPKDVAEMNVQDKLQGLKYDDEFNHGGRIKVVKVKKEKGEWVLAMSVPPSR